MRILIATWNRNIVGGAERYLQAILPSLLKRGHEISFLYERPVSQDRETIDRRLPIATWSMADLGLPKLMQTVREWKPDVVYSHGLDSSELETALFTGYPTVLFAHNYYGTCGTGNKCHSFPEVRPCGRRFGPMCLALHYPRRCGGLNPFETWRVFRRQGERNRGLPQYRAIIVASAHMYREFLQHGLAKEKLHLAPLPITDTAPQSAPPGPKAPSGRILLVGRLSELKGAKTLIHALAKLGGKLGPLLLTIAGDGPERQALQDLARELRVRTEFAGWIQTDQKQALMREADLLVVPSLWPEPFGLVGIEAGCVGLPAVAFDVGGISDWLIPGYSGELAPGDPPRPEGLAEAMVRALSNRDHYSHLCRGAWEVASRFTLDAHLEKLEPILGFEKPLSVLAPDVYSGGGPH
jgi:glycosyltransferase involved in cell wall biosynthesis